MALPAAGQTVCRPQEEASPPIPDRLFKIVLVGNSAVGKTSFLRRFCEDRFAPGLAATVGEFLSPPLGRGGSAKGAQEGTGGPGEWPWGLAGRGPVRAYSPVRPMEQGQVPLCAVPATKLIPHRVEPLNASFVQPEGSCRWQRWTLGPVFPSEPISFFIVFSPFSAGP